MMTTLLLLPLILFWSLPIFANDLTLSGEGVIQYRYPENFQESRRYIRQGVKTANGDREFNTKMRLKVGEKIYTKEIAYNPNTCESLIVEGLYTVEPQKKAKTRRSAH